METECLKLSAQSNHTSVELQQISKDCFFLLFQACLICFQPLCCLSVRSFLIFLQHPHCADQALCCIPGVMLTEQN